MPNVVTKGYKVVIISYNLGININRNITKGKQYSMTQSRIKRVSAALLAVVLTVAYAFSVSAAAQSLEYSASSSYKNSSYYKNLMNVQLTGDQVTDIVNVAKSQVGYHEGSSSYDYSGNTVGYGNVTEYGRWYGSQSYWCNVFVSWCAHVANVPASVFPKLTSVGNSYYSTMPAVGAECFSFSAGKALEPGDLIFSCTCSGSYGCIDHVGLVTDVDENTIYTVEGNMSDQVLACEYPASTGYSSRLRARINYVARPCYENNSTTVSGLEDASSTVELNGNVYALFDSSVSYSAGAELCKKAGGVLAGDLTDEEISALASLAEQGELQRYFITDKNECAVLTENGNVYKASENRSRTGFICKISVDEMKPSNTASFGGSKYEIFDASVTYAQAKAIAEAKGGSLAEIDSENKAMMLSLLLKNSDKYFTGVQGTEKELKAVCDAFKDETKFSEENVAVLLNDGSRKLGVSEKTDLEGKTGFIVEYSDSKKCTVIYDANGGENAPIEKIVNEGDEMVVTDVAPVKKNATFAGWAYTADATSAQVKVGTTIAPKKDIILYAVWA